ncbi:MAG: hypothetical protein QNJ92_07285 [Alphaproteobacteria bacterium]|nr:hypothetical protein [Alphaproteobacteria bacterium]
MRGIAVNGATARPWALLAGLLAALWIAAPAIADEHIEQDDTVILQLATEGWVETETARVTASIDAALDAGDLAAARAQVMEILTQLSGDGEWRVTRFDRRRDAAGLERWRVDAEARLPEQALNGLYDRAKKLSQPGRQVRVSGIQFTPTLAEREAVMAKLRAEIYRQAGRELEAMQAAFPDRAYRIGSIEFQFNGIAPPRRARAMAEVQTLGAAPGDAAGGGAPLAVAQQVRLAATVILSAERP